MVEIILIVLLLFSGVVILTLMDTIREQKDIIESKKATVDKLFRTLASVEKPCSRPSLRALRAGKGLCTDTPAREVQGTPQNGSETAV